MEPTAHEAPCIYPPLPTQASAPPEQQFRLSEISRLKTYLETEVKERGTLKKKYRRAISAASSVDGAMTVASLGLGCAGVGLLTTVIAAPVVIGLEAAALACGAAGIASKFVEKRLAAKERKHNEIRVLALSKANTIASHVSDALRDAEVSDKEFRIIMEEVTKYEDMKAAIRANGRAAHAAAVLDEEAKKALIQRGRDEAQASMMKALGPASAPTPQR